jgi:hypothetical protein
MVKLSEMEFIIYNYEESLSKRFLLFPFISQFKTPLILDRETRIRHLSKFPSNKYTIFKCIMLHINELPEDVIKYILYMMIDTDKIHLRLSIVESLLLLFNIEKLDIEFPKSTLTFWEMHEAMLIKIYENRYENLSKKFSYNLPKDNYPCFICKIHIYNIINDVGLCCKCDSKLKSKTEIVEDFKILDNISYDDFKNLKKITYYKYIKYDKSTGQLEFISKIYQIQKKQLTNYLTLSINQEKKRQNMYIEFSLLYINNISPIYFLDRINDLERIGYYNYTLSNLNKTNKIESLTKILEQEKKNTLVLKNNLFNYIKTANIDILSKVDTIKKEYKFVNKWLLKHHKKILNNKKIKNNKYGKR